MKSKQQAKVKLGALIIAGQLTAQLFISMFQQFSRATIYNKRPKTIKCDFLHQNAKIQLLWYNVFTTDECLFRCIGTVDANPLLRSQNFRQK